MTSERTIRRVLITGAAGEIGSALRAHWQGRFAHLRLTDVAELGPLRPGEEHVRADLTRPGDWPAVMAGVDAVVHLGGIPDEDSYQRIAAVNTDGTRTVLEAAVQAGVGAVAFASSIHAVGHYPRSVLVTPDLPTRPDTYYGASKVAGEALGYVYHQRAGLDFVAVRICSFQPRPQDARHLSTWLSPRDAAQLFERAVRSAGVGHLIVAGISGNTRRWMSDDGWAQLGYRPQDNAEAWAAELETVRGDPASRSEQRQGGVFTEPGYRGRAQGGEES